MARPPKALLDAIASVPAGRYAVAVSGGADSVALLHLLVTRPDLHLVVVHLDHETREGQSTRDAEFVQQLADSLRLPTTIQRRSEIEHGDLPANLQARYRALRLHLYHRAMRQHDLDAVLQAHHADDQAETIFMRLLRGTGIEGLSGMSRQSIVNDLLIVRPLLLVRRQLLRNYLLANHLSWREDASNAQRTYQRNRVRQLLTAHDHLVPLLLNVQHAFAQLADELESHASALDETLPIAAIANRHPLVQLHLLRQFAIHHGASADDLTLSLLERVRSLVDDAASGPAVCLPGGVEIRRRSREIFARPSPSV